MKHKIQIYMTIFSFIFFFSFFALNSSCFAYEIRVNPSPEIPKYQTQYVVDAVSATIKYMKETFGKDLERDVTINILPTGNSLDAFSATEEQNHVSGTANAGEISLLLEPDSNEYYIHFLTGHEMTHQYQLAATGSYEILNRNMWFIEGMADLLGAEIAKPVNPRMDYIFRSNAINKTRGNSLTFAVITDRDDWKKAFNAKRATYAKADMAMLYLTDRYPKDLLFVYLNHLATETADEALMSTYGITMNDLEKITGGKPLQELDELN